MNSFVECGKPGQSRGTSRTTANSPNIISADPGNQLTQSATAQFHNQGQRSAESPQNLARHPAGYCFTYSSWNECRKPGCPYTHRCYYCQQDHAASSCRNIPPKPGQTPGARRSQNPPKSHLSNVTYSVDTCQNTILYSRII